MNSSPIFSIVIPTHNRAHLLSRAIKSVLKQTLDNFELIVVDDVSTDHTQQIANTFSDSRIVYLRRDVNGGAAATRNSGIQRARGTYISFLDDDDEYYPDFLARMHATLRTTSEAVGLAWCGITVVDDQEQGEAIVSQDVWRPSYGNREHAYLSFLRSRRIGTNCGITIRKSCFATVGLFDEVMRKAEDTDFLTRMVRHFDFVVVPDCLVKVHRHAGPRLTVYDQQMGAAYERIIEKNQEALRTHRDLWTALHYKTGWLYYHGGNKQKARAYMRLALQGNWLHTKTWSAIFVHELLGRQAARLHQNFSLYKSQLWRRLGYVSS